MNRWDRKCECGAPVEIYFDGKYVCHPCRKAEVAKRPALPEVTKTRREVVVQYEGKTYRFRSKAEARRSMRALLRVKRLPPAVAEQI
jgi:hypothetical protein